MTVILDADKMPIHVEEEIRQWCDEKIANSQMIPAAAEDACIHASRFVFLDGRVVERDTGASLPVFMDALLEKRDHWKPAVYTDDEELAFGQGTSLAKRGAYLKKHGPEKYALEMARWGCSDRTLTPGKKPATGEDLTTKRPGTFDSDHRLNPFLHLRRKDGTIDERAQKQVESMIRAMGTKKVSDIAKAVNMTLTGLPLRK